MSQALEKVQVILVTKMTSEPSDEGLAEEMVLEQLEDRIKVAKEDTSSVVQEITSVMQVI